MSCAPANLDRVSASGVDLENLFVAMAKGKDPKGDGRQMAQETLAEWLTKGQVVDNKTITNADVAAAFKKTGKSTISFSDFEKVLADLASSKKLDLKTVKDKLLKVSPPK